MKKIIFLHFMFSLFSALAYASRPAAPVKFFPVSDNFNLFKGPSNKIILQGDSCGKMENFNRDLVTWRNKIGMNKNEIISTCNCGKKNIDQDIQSFFIGRELQQQSIGRAQLVKKLRTRKEVLSKCYLDVTDSLPKRAKEIALRQLILDENLFENSIYDLDGVNCYNTSLFVNGLIGAERYVDDYEIDQFLVEPICRDIGDEKPQPGDIISYYYQSYPKMQQIYRDGEFVMVEGSPGRIGQPIHLATYVSSGLIFDKKGGRKDTPFQLSTESYTEQVYYHPEKNLVKKYFRCLAPHELEKKLKDKKKIADLWRQVEDIESCYQKRYLKDVGPVSVDKMRDTLVLLHALVEDQINLRITYDDSTMTRTIHKGKEEEVVLLNILKNKIRTMIQDQFGRYF